jgi:hypothetical protein
MFLTRVEIAEDTIYQPLEDEVVLLNMKDQRYFGLNDIGSDMWKLLIEHKDVEPVVNLLCADYEVEEATVRSDLETLMRQLIAAGLLKASEVPSQGPFPSAS